MHIGRSIDAARRRVVMRAPEGVSGAAVVRAVAEIFRARPERASYDFIFNLLRFDGDTGNDDVMAIKAIYERYPREPGVKYAVIVSRDPNFALWAETMDHMFDDRRHLVFQTAAEAEAFLDEIRGLGG